jgi:acyl carrier protein
MIDINVVLGIIRKNGIKVDLNRIDTKELLAEQGIDSLDFASILFAIEEEYDVKINEDDIQSGKLGTIDLIIEFVNSKL